MTGGVLLILLGLCFLWEVATMRLLGLPRPRWMKWVGLALVALGIALLNVPAGAVAPGAKPPAARVTIPEASAMYRRSIEQAVAEEWGVEGSPARLAAQIHQESSWNPKARSPVGAEGLAQFMPATGRWLAQQFPELGAYDPWDPAWSARAAAVYDRWLLTRSTGNGQCSRWAFALSAYNGGEARLRVEQQLARQRGHDAAVWFGSVSGQRARSLAAWQQNRGYVRQILLVLEPAYIEAGWAGEAVCA